jgi:transposase-like protein
MPRHRKHDKHQQHRTFDQEFKLYAVRRLLAGERPTALSRELGLDRRNLSNWRRAFRAGGPASLRPRARGRPAKPVPAGVPAPAPIPPLNDVAAAKQRIAELERKIGQQQLELDFFQEALRQVRVTRRPSDGSGARASIASSRR